MIRDNVLAETDHILQHRPNFLYAKNPEME